MRNRFVVLGLSAVLCVALAACGSSAPAESAAASSEAASSEVVSSEAVSSEAASSEAASSEAPAADAALPDELKTALDGVLGYEADSAGGSLKSALVAANLAEYFAKNDAPANLQDAAAAWLAGLSEDDKMLVTINWSGISMTAHDIANDAAGQADLLETAGSTIDFSTLDTSKVAAAIDALDAALMTA